MFSKLLTSSDGKIPFLQIIIGAILGAIGMFVYAKFWKPKILFENYGPPLFNKERKSIQNVRNRKDPVTVSSDNVSNVETISVPNSTMYSNMPMYPTLPPQSFEQDEYSHEQDEDGDEDDTEEIEMIQQK